MGWEEQSNNDIIINLLKPENIEARCKASVEADGIVVKRCKNAGKPYYRECMGHYSVPTKNPYGRMKLGPDEGLCPVCSGAYDDPGGFLEF